MLAITLIVISTAPVIPRKERFSPSRRKEKRAVKTGQVHWMRATVLAEIWARA